jgi:hypothetical protein
MKNKLAPLGIYSLNSGSNICNELGAYAEGLDELFYQLDEMTREFFIPTAVTYGLFKREQLFGAARTEIPLAKRRQMLLDSEQTLVMGSTVKAFEKLLSSYGLENFKITEKFAEQETLVTVYDTLSEEMQSIVTEKAKRDFPAHLTITVEFVN